MGDSATPAVPLAWPPPNLVACASNRRASLLARAEAKELAPRLPRQEAAARATAAEEAALLDEARALTRRAPALPYNSLAKQHRRHHKRHAQGDGANDDLGRRAHVRHRRPAWHRPPRAGAGAGGQGGPTGPPRRRRRHKRRRHKRRRPHRRRGAKGDGATTHHARGGAWRGDGRGRSNRGVGGGGGGGWPRRVACARAPAAVRVGAAAGRGAVTGDGLHATPTPRKEGEGVPGKEWLRSTGAGGRWKVMGSSATTGGSDGSRNQGMHRAAATTRRPARLRFAARPPRQMHVERREDTPTPAPPVPPPPPPPPSPPWRRRPTSRAGAYGRRGSAFGTAAWS